MPNRNDVGYKEDNILKGKDEAISDIKDKLVPFLAEKLRAEQAVKNSIDSLSNGLSNDSSLSNSGQEKTQQRVRKIDNPFMSSPSTPEVHNQEYRPQGGAGFTDVDESVWRGGYSGPYILLLTGVLVLIGSLITYLVLSFR